MFLGGPAGWSGIGSVATRLYVVIARIPASLRSVSDEAIQHGRAIKLDCFAKLAMTRLSALAELPLARE